MHFLEQALFFQIYIDGPPGVPGVSKNQNFIFTYESDQFLADKTYRLGFFGFLGLGFWGFIFLCDNNNSLIWKILCYLSAYVKLQTSFKNFFAKFDLALFYEFKK